MITDPNHPAPVHDDHVAELRGFGLPGIIAILVIIFTGNIIIDNFLIPVGAILVLLWAKLSGTPWHEIGYAKTKNGITIFLLGILFGIALKFFMKALIMPLLGADPVNQTYHFLSGNRALIPSTLWTMTIVGFAEETVFRGFMFERLSKLLGRTLSAKIFIVIFTSLLFAAAHYTNQGIPGVEQALFTGLVFGTIYMYTKNIWLVMIAHSAFDLTAYGMIYYDLETKVAHLIFQ